MIQKRYQFYGPNGIEWTPWYDYSKEDSLLKDFQREEKHQLRCSNLLNEFRLV